MWLKWRRNERGVRSESRWNREATAAGGPRATAKTGLHPGCDEKLRGFSQVTRDHGAGIAGKCHPARHGPAQPSAPYSDPHSPHAVVLKEAEERVEMYG